MVRHNEMKTNLKCFGVTHYTGGGINSWVKKVEMIFL